MVENCALVIFAMLNFHKNHQHLHILYFVELIVLNFNYVQSLDACDSKLWLYFLRFNLT
jgi:hypothetical protein